MYEPVGVKYVEGVSRLSTKQQGRTRAGHDHTHRHRLYTVSMSTPSKMSVSVALTLTRRTTRFCQTLPSAVDCSSRSFKSGTRDLNVDTAASEKYRTIDDLSGPSLATTVYWLFIKGYADKSHAMQVGLEEGHGSSSLSLCCM